jgi:hypothetical protein
LGLAATKMDEEAPGRAGSSEKDLARAEADSFVVVKK